MTEEDREWRSSPIYQIFELFGRTWATPEEYDFLDRVLEAHAQKKVEEAKKDILDGFISEFCNDHNGNVRWLRGVAIDMPHLLDMILEYLKSKPKPK